MSVNKVIEILNQKERTLSFEFFPPKDDSKLDSFFKVVEDLISLSPDFISVTYGAGGSTRDKTMDISNELQKRFAIPTIHHITCVSHSKQELTEILDKMKVNGIINVLALRGDPPRGEKEWKPQPDGFSFAYQLLDLIKKTHGDLFSCGVAGFPEGHPEAPDKEADVNYLKNKIDHGGEFVITQLFFDNNDYFEYVSQVRKRGVEKRIIPGILPIMNFKNVEKFCSFIGTSIPPILQDIFTPIKDDLEITRKKGIKFAIEQCSALLDGGAPGLHFYTLNKLDPIKKIVTKLKPYFE